ncbi:MAG: flippase-like domain-containing protein [Polyangiaceae bacterium]|nr:flippase-like domain-containing protein [Polyangiaceae bacterium]MCW5790175.1 flippase-like domain-containing protein [Polyangiaceae bacterium]
MSRKQRLLWSLVAAAVTALLLYWMFDRETLSTLRASLSTAKWGYVVLTLLLLPLLQWARAWRYQLLLSGKLTRPPFELFRIGAYLVLLNYVLPFKMGEASFPLLASRKLGVSLGHAAGVLVVTRVVDMLAVLALGAGCALVVLPSFGGFGRPTLWLVLVGAVLALIALPMVARLMHRFASRLLRRFPRVIQLLDRLLQGITPLASPKNHLAMALSTAVVWLIQSALAVSAVAALASIPLMEVLFANAASILAFAVPINGVMGLGPPQAAWVVALKEIGQPHELAVSTALLLHGCSVTGAAILAGLVALVPPQAPSRQPAKPSSDAR